MDPRGPTKDITPFLFFEINRTCILFDTGNTKSNSPVYNIAVTIRRWVPEYPSSIFLVTSFTQKMPENSDSVYFRIPPFSC